MLVLAAVVKERPQIDMATPNFPASVNTACFNFPLVRFIVPAMLDTAILYILFPFLPYFVQYILNPITFCESDTEFYDKLRCRSTYWIGFIVLSYVAGNLISLPLWLLSVKYMQKKVAWGLGSILLVIVIPILAATGDKYMITAMILFFVIGLTQGGGFLQRSILADIIDYDELLQLRRNEGTYTGYFL